MPKFSPELAVRNWISGEAQDMLISVLNSVHYGILVTDREHVTLACNRRFGELFGIDIEKVVESDVHSVRDMVSRRLPDPISWEENLVCIYASPDCEQHDELVLQNPHQVLQRFTGPVRDGTGQPTGRLWTFLDVTSQARSAKLSELVKQVSTMTDPDPREVYRRIVRCISSQYNSTCLLSIRMGDFMQFAAAASPIPEAEALPGNNLADSYCQFCLNLNGPIIIQNALNHPEYQNLMPAQHGMTRYAGVPLIAPTGELFGTLCIMDGRSDEELAQSDLDFLQFMAMRISAELDRESQLRHLEHDLATAQGELIRSEKLAIAGTLAASIAHDIRNIVSAATLDLDLNPSSEPRRDMLRTHLDRFSILAHRLLSYAKPKEVSLAEVSIGDSLVRVIELLEPHFTVSRIHCSTNVNGHIPLVMGDPARIDHLFVNLCLNAIQAMPGGGELCINAEQEKKEVRVSISDTGKGISAKGLTSIFDPFMSHRSDGFGLGLYSCRQIINECGGTIAADSVEGQGTTFTIRFPAL